MADDREIEEKFWDELKDSPFIMLGVEGARDGATQPMTVMFEDADRDAGLLWIFTAKDHDLTRAMGQSNRAIGSYSAKGHGLFASLRGTLQVIDDDVIGMYLQGEFVIAGFQGLNGLLHCQLRAGAVLVPVRGPNATWVNSRRAGAPGALTTAGNARPPGARAKPG